MNASATVQNHPHPRLHRQLHHRPAFLHRWSAALLLGCSAAAHAQLVDGGFDTQPLTTMAAVIGGPTFLYGQWGQESSTLSTGVGPNVPASPTRMLSMTIGNSGTATQTAQAIDVSGPSFAGLIASGNAIFSYSALFNADSAGPVGGLSMDFFTGNSFATVIGAPVIANFAVDNIPGNWQVHTISGAIPVGTQSMLAQVYYLNASLAAAGFVQPGFVDSARLTIAAIPEPSTWAMMGLGGLLLGWRHRRQLRQGA